MNAAPTLRDPADLLSAISSGMTDAGITLSAMYDALERVEVCPATCDALLDLWRDVDRLNGQTWQVRAKLTWMLTQQAPLPGGRGKRDHAGVGVTAAINWLAGALGVSASTLWEDRRLYQAYENHFNDRSSIVQDRGVYVAALRASDPVAAIESIHQATDDGSIITPAAARRIVTEANVQKQLERTSAPPAAVEQWPVIYCAPAWAAIEPAALWRTSINAYVMRESVVIVQTPSRHLPDALLVLAGWGYAYSTTMIVPTIYDMADGLLDQVHDLLIFGIRGTLYAMRPNRRLRSILNPADLDDNNMSHADTHSVIDALYPAYPKLDVSTLGAGPSAPPPQGFEMRATMPAWTFLY